MLTKLAFVIGLAGLALTSTACVDELDEETQPVPDTEIADGTDDPELTDGIGEPSVPEDETCASEKKADGACVP